MAAKVLDAAFVAPDNLDLYGLLGDAELFGDLPLGDALELSKNIYFTTTGGQCINRIEQQGEFLPGANRFCDICFILNDAQSSFFSDGY